MQSEKLSTTAIITVSASDVFAVLADPSSHADIDGTGWVGRCATTLPNRAGVTPTYDWSEVPAEVRRQIQSPPSDEQHLDRHRRSYRCRGARYTRRQTGNHRRRRPRPGTSGTLNADRSVVIASAFAVGVRVDLVPAAGGVAPAARPWARVVVEQQAATGSAALPEPAGVRREELDGVSSNDAERR